MTILSLAVSDGSVNSARKPSARATWAEYPGPLEGRLARMSFYRYGRFMRGRAPMTGFLRFNDGSRFPKRHSLPLAELRRTLHKTMPLPAELEDDRFREVWLSAWCGDATLTKTNAGTYVLSLLTHCKGPTGEVLGECDSLEAAEELIERDRLEWRDRSKACSA